ncbi:polyprenyl synthetase family protein [Streptomyces sp. NEAU-S7GS2]|uniref:polyprenyl synthetase family protein n=1 Tax=Streptomyces sp. NEAU-S7GS2 TaxID=2202000 RepID=UPI000D6EF3C6|nr:polyprenyl synthetase family protein [Streptomyces sp. NEAU-S7GS2]AWN24856.1 polyprenyl synthetase family protein [Streptomyces sp. NEAU-S7GS2]
MEPTLRLLTTELERQQTGYDTGVQAMGREAVLPPGKLLRPVLLVEAAAAVGMPPADAVPAALSVEYLHVGALCHDVIDGDALRRGRPTVAARHGSPSAIVTGDLLIMASFQALADCTGRAVPAARVLAVVRVLAAAGVDLCRGQVMEETLQAASECSLSSYLKMVALKTSSLFRAAGMGGVLLAGGSGPERAAVRQFAEFLGQALQMSDDLLPYVSDTAQSGKPALSDMVNQCPTYPLLLCLQNAGSADRTKIADAISGVHPPEESFKTVCEVLTRTGTLEKAQSEARRQAALAKESLLGLRPGPARETLAAVADLCVDRQR